MSARRACAERHPPLDGPHRHWPETNCAVDLWLTALEHWGEEPLAVLGFTAAIGYEADQATFIKPPQEDLRALFGVRVEEMQIYRGLDAHLAAQLARGALPMVEVDAFHLPDTRGTDYATTHRKTTIGVIALDPAARHVAYLHNRTRATANGADYAGLLSTHPLPPYAEIARRDPAWRPREARDLATVAAGLLPRHLHRAAQSDPVAEFAARFPDDLAALGRGDTDGFHAWAFATLRQIGAAFELLGLHASWLGAATGRPVSHAAMLCDAVAEGAKTLQFHAARLVARGGSPEDCARLLDRMAQARRDALDALREGFG